MEKILNLNENDINKMRATYNRFWGALEESKDSKSKNKMDAPPPSEEEASPAGASAVPAAPAAGKPADAPAFKKNEKKKGKAKEKDEEVDEVDDEEDDEEDDDDEKKDEKKDKKKKKIKNEALTGFKTGKFETHVLCGNIVEGKKCGSPELRLSAKKTMIRCEKCGYTDLIENVTGVK